MGATPTQQHSGRDRLTLAAALALAEQQPDSPAPTPSAPAPADRRPLLDLAIACVDLTTLEPDDDAERVRRLCARAVGPDPDDPTAPPVAAVCVFPAFAAVARAELAGSAVRVACVAGDFPAGRAPTAAKVAEVEAAVAAGAQEVDVVLDRAALLDGRPADAHAELVALRGASGDVPLKVILETGELPDAGTVRTASLIAMAAGADFIKTSTGKTPHGASPEAVAVMAAAVADYADATGTRVGIKPSGGIRTADQALAALALARAVLGEGWLTPALWRFGASSLLTDLVRARHTAAPA